MKERPTHQFKINRETPSTLYREGVQTLHGQLRFGQENTFTQVLNTSDGRKEYSAVIDRKKIAAEKRLVVVKMHDDDEGIAAHTIKKLSDAGVAVFYITITNGNGRPRDEHTKDEVAEKRREEGVEAAQEMGAAAYINLDYHDMQVGDHGPEIKKSLVPYLRMIDPTMVMTLHPQDHNPDHAAGSGIVSDALYRARNTYITDELPFIPMAKEIPALYYMDPQSLVDYTGKTIKPGMLVKVFPNEKEDLDRTILAYQTQYTSPDQLWEFHMRNRQRGKLVGWSGAEGLTQDVSGKFLSNHNPLAEILGNTVLPTHGLRYRTRRAFHIYRKTQPVREA